MAENPFVVSRGGTHYLFFTDWQDPEDSVTVANPRTIVQYATSPSLAADAQGSAHWDYRGSIPDPGVNAVEIQRVACGFREELWLMSVSVAYPTSGLVPEHRRELMLRCIEWNADGSFRTANPGVR